MYTDSYFARFILPEDTRDALKKSRCLCYPETKAQLNEMCFGPTHSSRFDVCFLLYWRLRELSIGSASLLSVDLVLLCPVNQ